MKLGNIKKQHHLDTYEPNSYGRALQNLFKTPDDIAEEERTRREKKRKFDAEYRAKNLDAIRQKDNEYRQNEQVKERAREKAMKWRQENKERHKAWQKEKVECECGSIVTRSGLSTHRKMLKHLTFEKKKDYNII